MKQIDFGIKDSAAYLEQVDAKLKAQAPVSITGADRLLQTRGKRLRPGFVLAIAYHSGRQIDDTVINAAAAVELVHLASLIHDDMMDGGTLRHGVATINAREGDDAALLAGDYVLAKGGLLAAQVSAEAAIILADAITALCEGQAKELGDQYAVKRSIESLRAAAEGKTAALFEASVRLGGLVAGLDPSEIRTLAAFAGVYGIAFQYTDDVQDFVQLPAVAGKSVGNDIREGNYTLPVLLSLQGPRGDQLRELLAARASLPQVLEIIEQDGSLQRAAGEVTRYKEAARQQLDSLANRQLAAALQPVLDSL